MSVGRSLFSAPRATHGRHCSCGSCKQEDWTKITAPCGVHGSSCPAVYDPRPVIHILEQTVTERYFFDPAELKEKFGVTTEDEVIALFEKHDGSVYCDEFFYNDANPSVGVDIVRRYDDE